MGAARAGPKGTGARAAARVDSEMVPNLAGTGGGGTRGDRGRAQLGARGARAHAKRARVGLGGTWGALHSCERAWGERLTDAGAHRT